MLQCNSGRIYHEVQWGDVVLGLPKCAIVFMVW